MRLQFQTERGKDKHPLPNVIDAAAKWFHENNLGRN
jgi:hypothetical protein